jgi:hypothetical protein
MKRTFLPLLATLILASGVASAADQPPPGGPRAACKADAEKLCPGVQPGGGRIAACLKQNEAQVSTACKEAIAKSKQNKKAPGAPAAPQG